MIDARRGADLLVDGLQMAGVRTIFTLSGNHIMPVFDALYGRDIELVHVRHEAAAVHMADAYARLTGEVGVALVTGGQGHTNAIAALTTAQCADAPVVLLSGHAPLREIGRGSFQELKQAEMAAAVCKRTTTARAAETLAADLAMAMRSARSGRPGPVHLSLPVDVLETRVSAEACRHIRGNDFQAAAQSFAQEDALHLLGHCRSASRPLIIAGPMFASITGRSKLTALSNASGVPAVVMESPRGINDPCLGAFAEILQMSDHILLLGKPSDFTLRFAEPPFISQRATFAVVDPERSLISRMIREKGVRVVGAVRGEVFAVADALIEACQPQIKQSSQWQREVADAIAFRPASWSHAKSREGGIHPVGLMRAVQNVLARAPDSMFIADGGEIGQWAQACISARRRVINGVAGSIGASIPFALAARVVEKRAPVIAVLGDGTFGFHMAEFDTAVRHNLPFVAVVGNDSAWNAEYQIQLREYGRERAHSCELRPATRYDQVVTALGGYGVLVTRAEDIPGALEDALASGKPACVNVLTERVAAPVLRRGTSAP